MIMGKRDGGGGGGDEVMEATATRKRSSMDEGEGEHPSMGKRNYNNFPKICIWESDVRHHL
ncbi:hypothetical protein Syun_011739 [Stephania yunnanensis]|uniref:Uncharacterized protein n=1 Tax=Stephania yunnanensis TaxID=152371 RepID=A0AAP0JYV1_9MAGN